MSWRDQDWQDSISYADEYEGEENLKWAKQELISRGSVVDREDTEQWVSEIVFSLFHSGDYKSLINAVEELANFYDMSVPNHPEIKFKFKTENMYQDLIDKLTKLKEEIV